MRRLLIDLDRCIDCPYFTVDETEEGCFFCLHPEVNKAFEDTDFRNGGVPDFCPLPEIEEDATIQFNSLSARFAEVEGIPDAWLQGMSPAERRNLTESEEERLERILAEEGIDVSETVAYDSFEDTLHGNK